VHILGRPGAEWVESRWELLEQVAHSGSEGAGAAVIGTPDELVAAIRHLYELTGGFGVVLGFAHDWANREATARSWDLVARYVIPELNGHLRPLRASAEHLHEHKAELMAGASAAVMQKILANPRAADAMVVTMQQVAARRARRPEPDRSDADGSDPDAPPADEPGPVEDAP
jgi:limonene 1,2-monooxygenase